MKIKSLARKAAKKLLKAGIVRKLLLNRMPRMLHVEISSVCNLNCKYCMLREKMPVKHVMSLEEFESLRRYFRHMNHVYLSGLAEPLMNRNAAGFVGIIKKESSGRCAVSMFSNAMLLTSGLSERLIDSGLDEFQFSLDGVDADMVNEYRRGGDHERMIENVRELGNIKKKKKSPTPVLMATTVLHRKNYGQLPDTIDLAVELGVEVLDINGLEPYRSEMTEDALWVKENTPHDLPEVIEAAMMRAEGKGITIRCAGLLPGKPACYSVLTPVILPNGDVVPCAVLAYDREYFYRVDPAGRVQMAEGLCRRKVIGNVFEKNLEEILSDRENSRFRVDVMGGKFPAECASCLIKHQIVCVRSDYPISAFLEEARALLGQNQ
jgi:MoaA/NifB/PqqE/SkfB family radical SAM enzyme